jgi:hypothetical protein
VETEDTTSTEPDKVIRSDNTTHRTTGKQFYIGKEGFGFEGGGLGKNTYQLALDECAFFLTR